MMAKLARSTFVRIWLICAVSQSLGAPAFATDLDELIQSSCIECHDTNTETRLDFTTLGNDLESAESFRKWVHALNRGNANNPIFFKDQDFS